MAVMVVNRSMYTLLLMTIESATTSSDNIDNPMPEYNSPLMQSFVSSKENDNKTSKELKKRIVRTQKFPKNFAYVLNR